MKFKSLHLIICLLQLSHLHAIQQKKLSFSSLLPSKETLKETSKIVGLSFAAVGLYKLLHNQATARVCGDFFIKGYRPLHATILHSPNTTNQLVELFCLSQTPTSGAIFHMPNPKPFPGIMGSLSTTLQTTQSPQLAACLWAIPSTLVAGTLAAATLLCASRLGKLKKSKAKDLIKPLGAAMAYTAACSAFVAAFPTTNYLDVRLINVPAENATTFSQCLNADRMARAIGAFSLAGIALWTISKRWVMTEEEEAEKEQLMQQLKATTKP